MLGRRLMTLCKVSEAFTRSQRCVCCLVVSGNAYIYIYIRLSLIITILQTVVFFILLRPRPTLLLLATSHVRIQVEQTRLELLKWIGKHWLGIRLQW